MHSSRVVKFQDLSGWQTLMVLLRPVDGNPQPDLGHLNGTKKNNLG
jgi:hypothetical protein